MANYSLKHKIGAFLTTFPKENGIKNMWYCYNSIVKNLLPMPLKYGQPKPLKNEYINNTIWIYWNTGEDNAPTLVQKCINQARSMCPTSYQVKVLTFNDLKDFVDLPDFLYKKREQKLIGEAHFSDILRTTLLLQYGGFWMDATCYLSSPIPSYILDAPFFMFSGSLLYDQEVSPVKGSSWFIKSLQTNMLLLRTRDLLLQYWERNDKLIHYFAYHLVLAALADKDEDCRNIWENKPYICNMNPHVLQMSFHKNYSPIIYDQILNSSFIHKLTYKFDQSLLENKDNILNHLLKSI